MAEGYNDSLPIVHRENPSYLSAYSVAFDNYQVRLSGETLPVEGLPSVFDILCNGYEIDYETARLIAERARKDVEELKDPNFTVGTLDT